MVALKGCHEIVRTGRQLCDGVWRLATCAFAFREWEECMARCVLTFDRYGLVSMAKGVEQAKRDVDKIAGAELQAFGDPERELGMGRLSDGFQLWTGDRHVGTPAIIRFIVTTWMRWACDEREQGGGLSDPPTLMLRPGKVVVINGHYIRGRGDMPDGHEVEIPDGMVDGEFEDVPLIFTANSHGKMSIRFFPALRNRIGEGDFSLPFLCTSVTPKEESIVLMSVDTDFMYIGMLMSRRVFWMYWPKIQFCFRGRRLPEAESQKWADLGLLKFLITERLHAADYANPALFLAMAMNLAGGDYIDPQPRTPHHHYIRALLARPGKFKDIMRPGEDGRFVMDEEGVMVYMRNVFANKPTGKRPPPPEHVKALTRHADLYLYFLMQIEKSEMHDPPDLGAYGYVPLVDTEPMSRTNIDRVLTL